MFNEYMNINLLSQQFIPRTAARKEAEKICRLITSEFPAISGTIVSELNSVQKNPLFADFAQSINRKIMQLVRDLAWKEYGRNQEFGFYTTLVDCVKNLRMSNCADRAKLCKLICAINDIPIKKAEMFLTNSNNIIGERIDHAICILPINGQKVKIIDKLSKMKDLLIIDPWLGFVEFAPKFEQRILKDYNQFFHIPSGSQLGLFTNCDYDPIISKSLSEKFREMFPQLLIQKGKPLIEHNNM